MKKEFPMCYHNEWLRGMPPVRTIGTCPVHDYICPLCGDGVGCSPSCSCPDSLLEQGIEENREIYKALAKV